MTLDANGGIVHQHMLMLISAETESFGQKIIFSIKSALENNLIQPL